MNGSHREYSLQLVVASLNYGAQGLPEESAYRTIHMAFPILCSIIE